MYMVVSDVGYSSSRFIHPLLYASFHSSHAVSTPDTEYLIRG